MKIEKRKTRKGVINAAYKLLSNKKHWTKGADAIDKHGVTVHYDSPKAERFCVRGALRACSADKVVFADTYQCLAQMTSHGLVNVNDTYGYEAVMDILEKGKTECK